MCRHDISMPKQHQNMTPVSVLKFVAISKAFEGALMTWAAVLNGLHKQSQNDGASFTMGQLPVWKRADVCMPIMAKMSMPTKLKRLNDKESIRLMFEYDG